jgi:DNA-binding protein Fis
MAKKWLIFLFVPLVLVSCTANTQHGFFTGRQAEIVDLLRQANKQGPNADKSIALALQAMTENETEGDPCLDQVIHSHLARYYSDLGDQESASLYATMSLDDMTELILDPGIAQGFYEVWLLSYDAEAPIDFSSDTSAVELLGQFEALEEELDEAREDLEPEEAVVLDRLEEFVNDFKTGALNRDPRKLRRARGRLSNVFEGIAKLSEEEEDPEEIRLMQDLMTQVLTLYISALERDRRTYEQSARQAGTLMNRLFELGAAE